MKMNLQQFEKWGRKNPAATINDNLKMAVVYTRVSSKEQAEKNLSLDFQMRAIKTFAERNSFTIAECFGGTFESAKTDGRKEFQRMLEYVAANKGNVSHILVYTLDRFSRTGGAAIKLCDDLRNQFGVSVLAVTQPTDNSNPSGIFQQNIQLLFSEFDNQLRKQRAMAGMREKFERGIWCIRPPLGYTIVRENGQRKIIINQQGEILRNAFEWKGKGMKNHEIIEKLKLLGLDIYKQKLSAILCNPFYAGIISTKMLDGKIVEGTHEKLITPDLFLKIHKLKEKRKTSVGVPKLRENSQLPLKVFLKCFHCKQPLTGYTVKKDQQSFYYYKCRTSGCRCNQNATELNKRFASFLDNFSISEEQHLALKNLLSEKYQSLVQEKLKQQKTLEKRLHTLSQKLEALTEKFHVGQDIDELTYENLKQKYLTDRSAIEKTLSKTVTQTNFDAFEKNTQGLLQSLSRFWLLAPINLKEKLQQLIFPGGVYYSKDTGFEPLIIDPVFNQIKIAA